MKITLRAFAGLLIIGALALYLIKPFQSLNDQVQETPAVANKDANVAAETLEENTHNHTGTTTAAVEATASNEGNVPAPPAAEGAIKGKRLSQTEYRQIFHRNSGEFPLRLEQVLQWDAQDEEWKVQAENEMAANRVLVRSSSGLSGAIAEKFNFRNRTTTTPTGWTCFEFDYDSAEDRLGHLLAELDRLGHAVEPDYVVEASDLFSGDPLFQAGKQSYLDGMASFVEGSLNAATLWEVQTDASPATIAILDSGLHLNHEEFAGQLWLNDAEIPNNGIDDDNNGWIDDLHGYNFVNSNDSLWDDYGHGTHVAGLIGASGDNGVGIAGVCWRSSLMPIKVLNSTGSGFVSDVISGIHYAIDNGAEVMLLAWQTSANSIALKDALEAAQAADITWSVPAGNDSRALDEYPRYPAVYQFDNQITVASHDLDGSLSNFSNYGISHVAVSAPGNDVVSTGNGSNSTYERRTGTSQASAIVAGLLAHLKTAHPEEPGWRLIQRVLQSATVKTRENFYLHSQNQDFVATGRVNFASAELFAESSTPINDDLKGARRFERPSFFQSEIMLDATAEAGEPTHGGAAAESTVWYEWEPQDAGSATISTDHSSASLAVYRGGDRFDLFESVASAPAVQGGTSLQFEAQPRVVYFCVVNVPSGTSEPVRTDFRLLPENQNFSSASYYPLDGGGSPMRQEIALSSDSSGGNINEGWQHWVSPYTGLLKIRAISEMDARLTIYEVDSGGGPGAIVESVDVLGRGSRSKERSFDITANTAYAFRWQSLQGGSGYVEWNGTFRRAPTSVGIYHYRTSSPLWGTEFRIGSSVFEGTAPFTYKWYRDGQLVRTGTWSYYTPSVDFSDSGTYKLVVSNELGTVESDPLEISVRALPPRVWITPGSVKSSEGADASFYANVADSLGASVSLEWFLNGQKLQDSTLRILNLENLTLADSGILKVKATNRFGSDWSQEVMLSITENPLTDWKRVMPNTAGYNLKSAGSVGNRYFVTASGPTLYTSPDGVNWVEAVFDQSLDYLTGITYGNGMYMAVGKRISTPVVLSSEDGIFWETIHEATGGSYSFAGLTFGNGRFVTLRNINWSTTTMYSSTDGRNWETTELNTKIYRGPLFANGIFLISYNGTHLISSDGQNWTAHAIASDGPTRTGSMTYYNGYFYKISGSSFSSIGLYRSTDGITWETVSAPGFKGAIYDDDGLYYDGENFMIPSDLGIYYSATGDQFLRHTGNETGDSSQGPITSLALLGEELIGITDDGRIILGETISDLTFNEPIFGRDIHRMEALESALVVMGGSAATPYEIAWTRDGVSWDINDTPRLRDIVEWNQQFYAIGAPNINYGASSLIVSSDLNQWSSGSSLPGQGELIEAGNGRLVVALEDGTVTTSLDGVSWSTPQATNGQTLRANEMRFLNGEFWLARDSGLHRSADGINWQEVALTDIKDITYASGKYIATPYQNGVLYESTDGNSWTEVLPGGGLTATRLKTDGISVYGALNNSLLYSKNLAEWTSVSLEARSTDVAYFNGSIFYSAAGGLVYRHGVPTSAPSLSADLTKTLNDEPIDLSSNILFDYSAESGSGTVTVSLYVDGELVDQSSDGSSLSWTPTIAGRHQIQIIAEDSNGLKNWTDSVEAHVKGPVLRHVSNPADQEATGLLSKNNAAWITMARGDLYYRSDPSAEWVYLDAGEAVNGFNGAYKDEDGRLYAYGWVIDAFGASRGIVLRSNEGEVWERVGGLLPNPVIKVLSTKVEGTEDTTFYALTLDPSLTASTAASGLHYRTEEASWIQVSGVDTLRDIIEWNGRLYAKDRSGNVLVSDDSFEWTLEFDTGSFDTRDYRLEATEEILLLNDSSRTYHNRVDGNAWGYISPSGRTLIVEDTVYVENYEGFFELTTQGLLEPSERFDTFYPGPSLGYPIQVEWGDGWSLWRTNTGKITSSNSNDTGFALEQNNFPDSSMMMIGKLAFRDFGDAGIAPLNAPEGWSSNSLAEIATQDGIRDIAFGDAATMFVGETGLYRHDPLSDSWTQIRASGDLHAITHSSGRFWLGGVNIFEYSDDNGDTWTSQYDDLYTLIGYSLVTTQIIADGDRVAVNAVNRNILLSTDGGSSWVNTGSRANRIAFSPTALVYVSTGSNNLGIREPDQEFLQVERFPFGLPSSYFPEHSWDIRDYLWYEGTEYLLLGNYDSGALLQRTSGLEWEVVEFPRPILSTGDYLARTNSKVFWVSTTGISQVVSHNFKTSLTLAEIDDLGVGDSFEAIFKIMNQGVGLSPETSFTVKAFLQRTEKSLTSRALPIGSYRADIPQLSEGESHNLSLNLQMPDFVTPGRYYLKLSGIGMHDTRSADNTAVSANPFINIPTRTVNIQVNGSGSVTILDSRSEYPDKFALPIQINPEPGYVYSFAGNSSGEVSASGLQTVILDESFDGSVYFEPSFETWAAAEIPSTETRARSGVAYGGLPNIFKYVFGYKPTNTSANSPLTLFEDNISGERSVAFEIMRGREHDSPVLMISSDLGIWDILSTETTPNGDRIRFDASVPETFSDRAFFQLQAD